MNHCGMMAVSKSYYFDISRLKLHRQLNLFWVTAPSETIHLWGGFPLITCLLGCLTTIALLCLQAWDPAESPGECTSSSTAPSASPWASRAPGAGGGDPGLWRWGARGPRRLLQRSDAPAHTPIICPRALLPLSMSVSSPVTLRLSALLPCPPSILMRAVAAALKRHVRKLWLQGCLIVAWEARRPNVPQQPTKPKAVLSVKRLIFVIQPFTTPILSTLHTLSTIAQRQMEKVVRLVFFLYSAVFLLNHSLLFFFEKSSLSWCRSFCFVLCTNWGPPFLCLCYFT